MIIQKEITLGPFRRGFHLITKIIESKLDKLPETGLLNLHLKHTSAALALNENADPSVRQDFSDFIDKLIPENSQFYTHTLEGDDDMPAHLKSALIWSNPDHPYQPSPVESWNMAGYLLL